MEKLGGMHGTNMQLDARKARVFISCGQNKQSNEVKIAHEISLRLEELGFEPYVAVQEQTLKGLKENIFNRLENPEYFVFVDFKREQLAGSEPLVHRGSLFSHQELAVASFLEIEVIAFQEKEMNSKDGIVGFLQMNPTPFYDREQLPDQIGEMVKLRKWNPLQRNELVIEREPSEYSDSTVLPDKVPGRFFHLSVRNLHSRKTAQNCYFYLERAFNIDSQTEIPLKTIELKWSGYTLPNAYILPGSFREVDAFWVNHNNPSKAEFSKLFSDSTKFHYQIEGTGEYELTYSVVSDNFPKASISLHLKLTDSLNEINLEEKT